MRIEVPQHHVSFDPSADFVLDEMDPEKVESFGAYIRSVELGVFLNVRSQDAGAHPLTLEGLAALLHEQNWASAPFDEWTSTSGALSIAGATFETTGMGGEVVLEVFVTDGRRLVNVAGPGHRVVIRALTPSVRRLANTFQFT